MLTAVLTIILFGIMIIPHEFGHFITAKLCDVQVNEFSIGMGPALLQKQKGETLYSVRALPLGGYCRMEGEDEASDNPRTFTNKKNWQKLLILSAGAFMNVVAATLIMIVLVTNTGVGTTTMDQIEKGSPAYTAGMESGDRVVSINGTKTDSWSDITNEIDKNSKGETMIFTVLRDGEEETLTVEPEYSDTEQRWKIGITGVLTHNILTCTRYGVIATWDLGKMMVQSFKLLLTGQMGKDDLSGPVGMVSMVNRSIAYGPTMFLYLAALICLNLAFINILPFPALDGGRIVFVLLRMVSGGHINDDMEGNFHLIGMAVLFALFLFITWNDIARLLG